MIAAIILFSLFIAVNLVLTISILLSRRKPEPKEAILRNPSNEMVVCGVTREDLKQAKELSEEWARSFVSESLRASRTGEYELSGEQLGEDLQRLELLLSSGRITRVPSETSCLIIESRSSMYKVQITEGLARGQNYWVYKEFIAGTRPSGGDIVTGILAYFRYLITAFICCLGIYYLRIKSFFIQMVCFIMGFIVLIVVWNRIAELFV